MKRSFPQKRKSPRGARRGSVLLLTLLMIMLMAFEVALVSLVVMRGMGEQGMVGSQSIVSRRAAESAINRLAQQINADLQGSNLASVAANYALGGSSQGAFNNQVLQVTGRYR